jgi:hypothetical protein
MPLLGRHDEEASAYGVMHVQVFGAILDLLACHIAVNGGGGIEHAGFDAPCAEAAPVRLSQTQYQRVFNGALGLEGVAKALEDFFVFVRVLFGKDDDGGGSEPVFYARKAAPLPTRFGLSPSSSLKDRF